LERAEEASEKLRQIVGQFVEELHRTRKPPLPVGLGSSLEKDLGIDSLGRVELMTRIENTFQVSLPAQTLAEADTLRDLLQAVLSAGPEASTAPAIETRPTPLEPVQAAPVDAQTLLDVLDWHVRSHPERPHIHLVAEVGPHETVTYADLMSGAEQMAAGLLERSLKPGQTVAIMLPTGREYFFSFVGILLAGGIPVPLYPPVRLSQIEDHLRRHAAILVNAEAAILITLAEAKPIARLLKSQVESLRQVLTPADLMTSAAPSGKACVQAALTAFLQYTSGSTGNPKGVVLTHANLLANIRAMGEVVEASSEYTFVSWLPLYHDMGLIGAWMGSLYFAMPLVLMSPLTFLARPERWLRAIHQYGGTMSGGPNFAYELCLRRIPDAAMEGLDLSSWRIAFNGAEPVSPETLRRFQARFGPCGFRAESFTPVYGLAESSVGLAFPPLGRGPLIDRIQREHFMRSGRALPAPPDDAAALIFPACGEPLPGHEIRIVDSAGRELGEREEGSLEFRGPSVTSGYYRNPEETARLFHDGWIVSGDLAYTAGGEVYITGRRKDIIIRAGRNIYPHELEEAVGNLAGIRKGCVAAFGTPDPVSQTERLVIVAETREGDASRLEKLQDEIHALSVDLLGAPPDDVVLAAPHTVLKTSSGKIRRAASRELYETGDIGRKQRAVWWQFLRLASAGVLPQLRRSLRRVGALLYAGYAWIVLGIMSVFTWSLVACLPSVRRARALSRAAARLTLRLGGVPLSVHGLEKLPETPAVLAANHASYLDGLMLTAALPPKLGYVAKRELTGQFFARIFLNRIGTAFVERFDLGRGVDDTRRIGESIRSGASLVFFPEGTFRRNPGLRPFHMGAFVSAAQAGMPVVPVSIRGTRSILRGGSLFPRRGSVTVTISDPVRPEATHWTAAVALREAVRAEILRHCGEPDLRDNVLP
jgi:1-acyl-sn-glycerol-3-phosphate acyltransferase